MQYASDVSRRQVKVFVASPGDLTQERRVLDHILMLFSSTYGGVANVEFKKVGWEDVAACATKRSQDEFNKLVDECDAFILILWKRWGQTTDASDPYSSYTLEEFNRALDRWRTSKRPSICVLFKHIDKFDLQAPDEQLSAVLDFRESLERSRQVVFKEFHDELTLCTHVHQHLATADGVGTFMPVPESRISADDLHTISELSARAEEVMPPNSDALGAAEERSAAQALALVSAAAKLAAAGLTNDAQQAFISAVPHCVESRALLATTDFFLQTGDLDQVLELANSARRFAKPEDAWWVQCRANIAEGTVAQRTGRFSDAMNFFDGALVFARASGDPALICSAMGSRAIQLEIVGKLSEAAEAASQAVQVARTFQYPRYLAVSLNTLGVVARRQGSAKEAQQFFEEAQRLGEQTGDLQIAADAAGNLSTLAHRRGDLDEAERLLHACIAVESRLMRRHGEATGRFNLGCLYAETQRYNDALAQLDLALQISVANRLDPLVLDCHVLLAVVCHLLRQGARSRYHACSAISLCSIKGLPLSDLQKRQLSKLVGPAVTLDGTLRLSPGFYLSPEHFELEPSRDGP